MSLLLIDIGSVYWAGWYATRSQTGAYELAVDAIERACSEHWRAIVCCDSPRNWRHDLTGHMAPEVQYKANREKKPPEATEALADVQQRVAAWGVPVVLCDGYEADDVIATLVDQALAHEVRILSEDKDLYQLIDDHCFVLTKNGVRDAEGCVRKFGVRPDQMRDLLTLTGDSSDNIQGCPGIGVGKAAALLNRFGTLDAIKSASPKELGAVRGVGKQLATNLLEWDHTLARALVSLATDAPVQLETLIGEDDECVG